MAAVGMDGASGGSSVTVVQPAPCSHDAEVEHFSASRDPAGPQMMLSFSVIASPRRIVAEASNCTFRVRASGQLQAPAGENSAGVPRVAKEVGSMNVPQSPGAGWPPLFVPLPSALFTKVIRMLAPSEESLASPRTGGDPAGAMSGGDGGGGEGARATSLVISVTTCSGLILRHFTISLLSSPESTAL